MDRSIIEVLYNWPAEIFIKRHVVALIRNGLNVQIVARHGKDDYKMSASVDTAEIDETILFIPNFDHLNLFDKFLSARYLLYNPGNWILGKQFRDQVLLAFFRGLKPALIHFHTASLAALMHWIPSKLGIPYTISLRGSDVQVFPLRSADEASNIREAILGGSRVHTVCDQIAQEAKQTLGISLKHQTIYTTVPIPEELPVYKPQTENGLNFLAVGRLHWRKNYVDLLKAIWLMRKSSVEIQLTLVGSGPDKERLEYFINALGLNDAIFLTDKLSFAEIQDIFGEVHGFIQASMAEGFSNAVAEAMAWGCPVFATDVGGTSELIRDMKTGILLPTLQPESWPEKLLLARDNQLMNRLRRSARQIAVDVFSPQKHAELFEDFYRQALHTRLNAIHEEVQQHTTFNQDQISSHPVILLLGQWEWQSGSDILLRAISFVNQTSQPLTFMMAGKGSQEDELRYLHHHLDMGSFVDLKKIPKGEKSEEKFLEHLSSQSRQVVLYHPARKGEVKLTYGDNTDHFSLESIDSARQALVEIMQTQKII